MNTNTIERLRASKAEHFKNETSEGREAGEKAAREFLEYEQLVKLRELNNVGGATYSTHDIANEIGDGDGEYLFGEGWQDWSEQRTDGWIEGAVAVFDEVEGEL